MKLLTDKHIDKIQSDAKLEQKKELFRQIKDISKKVPKRGNAIEEIILEQLDRVEKNITDWRVQVEAAEDIDNPDRQELMEMYRDFIDDYQLWATMQSRINKAISGSFRIMDEDGEIDEEETSKFLDPQGFPLQWFRDFMIYVMHSMFYGWEAIQLGDVIDNSFKWVQKIPEENQVPFYDSMKKDANMPFIPGDSKGSIFFGDDPYNTWIVRTGSKTDLGLINKCAPYIIWKKIFGNWAQHASVFGMPLRVGTTDISDNERKQNLIDAFTSMEEAFYFIKDLQDEVEFIKESGGSDPHNIYGELINKCDQAISKIILSQTGTTDEKAFAGSAGVHANTENDLILSDKQMIKSVINNELIPRMRKIGMIPEGKKIFGGWDQSEKLTISEWAGIIQNLSQSGFSIEPEDVEKKTTLKVDETIVPVPENKTFSIMNMYNKVLKKNG